MISCIVSVSYTHLDVYKRQPIGIEQYFAYMELLYRIQVLECFRNLEQTAPVSAELPVLSAPVSYTHLDVYKRQCLC